MLVATSMYYTFSTIAQVLAGFLALSGVFVINKIDILNKSQINLTKSFLDAWHWKSGDYKLEYSVSSCIDKLKDFSTTSEDYISLFFQMIRNMTRLKEEVKDARDDFESVIGEVIMTREQMIDIQLYKHVLIFLTKHSLYIGVSTIILSITTLSMIHKDFILYYSTEVLFTLILGSALSLILMVFVILFSISDITLQNKIYKIIKKYMLYKHPKYSNY